MFNVFVADDSKVVRERLISNIEAIRGVSVVGFAENGLEANKCIHCLKPDLTILDIRMPGRNGIDVLENIRKDKVNTLVMMLTNFPDPVYKEKCLKLGSNFFLDKSTEIDDAITIIEELAPIIDP